MQPTEQKNVLKFDPAEKKRLEALLKKDFQASPHAESIEKVWQKVSAGKK
jgi:hypothetical protein